MKHETAILKAFSNVDETFLTEAETYSAKRSGAKLRRWIPAAVAAMLVLTIGAAAAFGAMWDELFIDRLEPTATIVKKTEGMLDDVQATAVYDNVEITVTQTYGDAMTMYIALDVKFADSIDLAQYATTDENGESIVQIAPNDIRFYKADTANEQWPHDFPFSIHGSYSAAEADLSTNSVRFLLEISDTKAQFDEYPIKLVIDSFSCNMFDGPIITEGPYELTWQPKNIGTVYEFELQRGEEKVGDVKLSALSMHISILESELKNLDLFDELYEKHLEYYSPEEFDEGKFMYYSLLGRTFRNSIHFVRHGEKIDEELCAAYEETNERKYSLYTDLLVFDEVLDFEEIDSIWVAGFKLELK